MRKPSVLSRCSSVRLHTVGQRSTHAASPGAGAHARHEGTQFAVQGLHDPGQDRDIVEHAKHRQQIRMASIGLRKYINPATTEIKALGLIARYSPRQ